MSSHAAFDSKCNASEPPQAHQRVKYVRKFRILIVSLLSFILTIQVFHSLHAFVNHESFRDSFRGAPPSLHLRNATLSDIDAVVNITLAAFDPSPDSDLLAPHRHEHWDHFYACSRASLEAAFRDSGNPGGPFDLYPYVMALPPSKDYPDGKPVAVGFYARLNQNFTKSSPPSLNAMVPTFSPADQFNCTDRPEYSEAWMEAMRNKTNAAAQRNFNDVYGQHNHFYLAELATHPDYQRLGAGTALLRQGMEYATRERIPITLLATDTGRPLYEHVGFRVVEEVIITVEGREGKIRQTAMVWDPPNDEWV